MFVLKAQTPVLGVMEAASSCAFTWVVVVGLAPAPMVAWQRTALPVNVMKVICFTVRGPY